MGYTKFITKANVSHILAHKVKWECPYCGKENVTLRHNINGAHYECDYCMKYSKYSANEKC